jgi:hypothetical protein
VWHIVDYKTNHINKNNVDDLVKSYSLQLDVYAWLVLTLYPETPCVTTHLFFLEAPSRSVNKNVQRGEYPRLQAQLEKYLNEVIQTQKDPQNAIKNEKHCPECGFFRNKTCLASQ